MPDSTSFLDIRPFPPFLTCFSFRDQLLLLLRSLFPTVLHIFFTFGRHLDYLSFKIAEIYFVMDQNGAHSLDTTTAAVYKMPTPTDEDMQMRLVMIDDLKLFLATAPTNWNQESPIKQLPLPTGEQLSCILWGKLFHITGTDIVRSLMFRFHAFGRPISNFKKFEEGIFSDLRNLKPGTDACLEEPKSEFLDLLYKNKCIRTQKKQKVFYWYSVPHDRLFLDALERDLKREKMGIEPTSIAVAQPAKSISLDTTQELFDNLRKSLCLSSSDVYNENIFSGGICANHSIVQSDHLSIGRQSSEVISTWPPPVMLDMETNSTSHINNEQQGSWITVAQPEAISTNVESRKADMMSSSAIISGSASLLGQDHRQFSPPQPPLVPSQTARQAKIFHRSTRSVTSVLSADGSLDSFDEDGSTGSRNTMSPPNDISPLLLSVTNQSPLMFDQSATIEPMANDFNRLQLASNSALAASVLPSKSVESNSLRKSAALFGMFSLFEGSPSYKQRRRRSTSVSVPCQQTRPINADDTLYARSCSRPAYTHNRSCSQPNFGMSYTQQHDQQGPTGQTMAFYGSSSGIQFASNDLIQRSNMDDSGSNPMTRSYICPMPTCARLFKRLEHLKRHLRTHTMERPYICSICGKRFSRSDNLAQHKKTHERRRERGMTKAPAPESKTVDDDDEDDVRSHRKSPSYSEFSRSEVNEAVPKRSHSSKRRRGILTHDGQADGMPNDGKGETSVYQRLPSSSFPLDHNQQQLNPGEGPQQNQIAFSSWSSMALNSNTLEKSNDGESSSSVSSPSLSQLNLHSPTHKRFSSSGQYMTLFSAFRPESGLLSANSTLSRSTPYAFRSSHHRSKSMSSYHIPFYDQYHLNSHINQTNDGEIDGIPMVLI